MKNLKLLVYPVLLSVFSLAAYAQKFPTVILGNLNLGGGDERSFEMSTPCAAALTESHLINGQEVLIGKGNSVRSIQHSLIERVEHTIETAQKEIKTIQALPKTGPGPKTVLTADLYPSLGDQLENYQRLLDAWTADEKTALAKGDLTLLNAYYSSVGEFLQELNQPWAPKADDLKIVNRSWRVRELNQEIALQTKVLEYLKGSTVTLDSSRVSLLSGFKKTLLELSSAFTVQLGWEQQTLTSIDQALETFKPNPSGVKVSKELSDLLDPSDALKLSKLVRDATMSAYGAFRTKDAQGKESYVNAPQMLDQLESLAQTMNAEIPGFSRRPGVLLQRLILESLDLKKQQAALQTSIRIMNTAREELQKEAQRLY